MQHLYSTVAKVTTDLPTEEWMERARCRDHDPDLFFPLPGPGMAPAMAAAKSICAMCPVVGECLDYAMAEVEIIGVWGGTSARERVKMRRERQAA